MLGYKKKSYTSSLSRIRVSYVIMGIAEVSAKN